MVTLTHRARYEQNHLYFCLLLVPRGRCCQAKGFRLEDLLSFPYSLPPMA